MTTQQNLRHNSRSNEFLTIQLRLKQYCLILQVLDLVSLKQSDVICTAALQHSDKNRRKDFLPCKFYKLSLQYSQYCNNYSHVIM